MPKNDEERWKRERTEPNRNKEREPVRHWQGGKLKPTPQKPTKGDKQPAGTQKSPDELTPAEPQNPASQGNTGANTPIPSQPVDKRGISFDDAVKVTRAGSIIYIAPGVYRARDKEGKPVPYGEYELTNPGITFHFLPGAKIDGAVQVGAPEKPVPDITFVNPELFQSDSRVYQLKTQFVHGERANGRNGFNVLSPRCKIINPVVYNTIRSGIGFWKEASDSLLYGAVVFNCGISRAEHAIYGSNTEGFKDILENILVLNACMGLCIRESEANEQHPIRGFRVKRNFIANNAPLYPGNGRNIGLGQNEWFEDNEFDENVTYQGHACFDVYLNFKSKGRNRFASSNSFQGIVEGSDVLDEKQKGKRAGLFKELAAQGHPLPQAGAKKGFQAFIYPNQYQKGRAHIYVLNDVGVQSYGVNLSGLLEVGQKYEIRNAFNYFGQPQTGVYDGKLIPLNLMDKSTAKPYDGHPSLPKSALPFRGAFVCIGL